MRASQSSSSTATSSHWTQQWVRSATGDHLNHWTGGGGRGALQYWAIIYSNGHGIQHVHQVKRKGTAVADLSLVFTLVHMWSGNYHNKELAYRMNKFLREELLIPL